MAHRRDSILTDFIRRTGSEPGIAADVLEAARWDLGVALKSFESIAGVMQSDEPVLRQSKDQPVPEPRINPYFARTAEDRRHQMRDGRTMSVVNHSIVCNMHEQIGHEARDRYDIEPRRPGLDSTVHTPTKSGIKYANLTMSIPDLSTLPAAFREFIEEDLLDNSMRHALEKSGENLALYLVPRLALISIPCPFPSFGLSVCL